MAMLDDRVKAAQDAVREYHARLRTGEVSVADDPQPRLALDLFHAWRDDPDREHAATALETAFMFWGNTAHADAAAAALTRLDVHADYWDVPLHGAGLAHARAGRSAEYVEFLERCRARLTHRKSLTAALSLLGQHYLRTDMPDRAADCYRRTVDLAANPWRVRQAEGALHEIATLQPGQPAPDFAAVTLDGGTVALAGLRGRPVLLSFWSTTCEPCHGELPFLREIRAAHQERDLAVIGISQDRDEARLRSLIEHERLDWPHIHEPVAFQDELPVFGPICTAYNARTIPRTVLIARDGAIVAKDLRGAALVREVADESDAMASRHAAEDERAAARHSEG
ncbi:MAG: TlpA family protein disulfide reductase [Gemmatimonadetes bacterium]|nr:TlpA family protein disulfide reductase [Gemmatimonadota bacterium]